MTEEKIIVGEDGGGEVGNLPSSYLGLPLGCKPSSMAFGIRWWIMCKVS